MKENTNDAVGCYPIGGGEIVITANFMRSPTPFDINLGALTEQNSAPILALPEVSVIFNSEHQASCLNNVFPKSSASNVSKGIWSGYDDKNNLIVAVSCVKNSNEAHDSNSWAEVVGEGLEAVIARELSELITGEKARRTRVRNILSTIISSLLVPSSVALTAYTMELDNGGEDFSPQSIITRLTGSALTATGAAWWMRRDYLRRLEVDYSNEYSQKRSQAQRLAAAISLKASSAITIKQSAAPAQNLS